MPCIWGQHNGLQLLMKVAILPPSAALAPEGGTYLGPSEIVDALVDTGATTTGITSRLAARLQMQPVGRVPIHGVGGVQHHNSHLFLVAFPFLLPPAAPASVSLPGHAALQLHVLQRIIQGCEFQGGNASFEVILGMDVLSTGSLVVQGNQTFSFFILKNKQIDLKRTDC
jgi:hypothetical protein